MEDANKMLAEQQRELERIRRKRKRGGDTKPVCRLLNVLFLVLALVGLVLYFAQPDKHVAALVVIGVGMGIKIVEFFIRFML